MNRLYTILRYVAAFACLALCIAGYIFYCDTIITWWYPIAAALVPAVATAPQFYNKWRIATTSDKAAINVICHLIVVGSVLYASLLGANYLFADTTTDHVVHATILSKSKETHKKYRTVGRRRRVQNGTYDTFHLYLGFADGSKKSMTVTRSEYNRVRTGGTKTLSLQKGLFGFTVIKNRQRQSAVPQDTTDKHSVQQD
ncbi:hypothetical protein [Xylanibacter caecicola]|uniref:hypothetical protein n=1 Tax=Xylanibacter caecicola TaxID=2736294 RepID=UPI0025874F37|nr:hypothetical protein [Xylanibacter caecicola]